MGKNYNRQYIRGKTAKGVKKGGGGYSTYDDQVFMVCGEIGCSIEYVMYSMDYLSFIEAYNHILMYKHGYTRKWKKSGTVGRQEKWVWDEENENMIEFMPTEKDRYEWEKKRNCYVLRTGK